MGIDIEKVLGPVAVVSGLGRIVQVVGRMPNISHRRGDPEGGHAQFVEVAAFQRQFQPPEIAAVVEVDMGLFGIVERGVATARTVVAGVAIEEAIR